MSLYAFVTLLTTDAYLPGALVAIQSVLEAEGPNPSTPFETVCLVTPATVSVESIKALRRNFSLVVGVEELRSGSSDNLELLGRQDLASTLTKLQLFRLIQFKKLIFLDADTLCLQPLSHLFKLDAPFSACPDAGWPDCFNSGMFVCNPSVQTFDGLVEMASQRGSWDGGDQGLLNDFFPDWNRLSFTYNVTPSAYYTYAPAYRRHGAEIKLVHFIGTDKPWYQASSRGTHIPSSSEGSGSSSSSSSKDDGGAHDYASLLDRWFSVYQRYFGKASNTTFTFPTLQAVWDAPGGGHSRASYTPPSLEELKRQFQGIQAAHLAASSSSSSTSLVSSAQQQQRGGLRSLEGHYVSMPLKPGRPDLLGKRVFIPRVPTTTTVQGISPGRQPSPPIAPPHIVAPVPIRPGHQQGAPAISVHAASPEGGAVGGSSSSHQQERHHQREGQPHHHASYSSSSQDQQQQQQNRAWSPQNVSWDPARSEPPKNDRPQMEAGFHYQAENAWDAPKHSSQHRSFFRAPAQYGSIPAVTHQNYSDVARASPDESKLKPVFPWEQYQQQQHHQQQQQQYQHHHHHQHYQHGHGGLPHASSSSGSYQDHYHQQQYHHNRPTRVFPPEESRKPTLTPTRPAPPPPTSPGSSRSHTPSHLQSYGQHQHQHKPAPSPVITDFANLSSAYTNAWDDVAGIRRYAKSLSGKGGDEAGRTGSGSRRGGNGSGSGGGGNQQQRSSASHHHHHQHSQSTSSQTSSAAPHQSHSRSASYQTSSRGSSLPDRDQRQRERTSSAATSGSGYDTGGEASSRDGDDEDEDDDEEEGDGYLPHGGRGGGSAAASNKTRNASRGASSPSYLGSGTAGSASISLNSGGSNGLRPDVNSVRLPSSRTSSSETITSSSGHMGLGTVAPPPGTQIPGLPDTSTGNYKPSRVSRVFDPSTATDVIRKEGLDALHRFVRSMEARGAAANGRQVDESLQ